MPFDVLLDSVEIRVYQRAISHLMYLMVHTHPDIAHAVSKLAQFAARLTLRHWYGIIRILRYLHSHDSVRLTLGHLVIPKHIPLLSLLGYFDASLMDCTMSRKSTEVYVFFLDGALIS